MKRFFAVSIISLFAFATIAFAQERRLTIDDLLKVRRVGDPQVSPKSDFVAFTITDVDKVANKSTTQIYLVPLSGGEPRQLTNDEHSSNSPRWSPDGDKLAFISARDGEDQIWTIDVSSGELKKSRRVRSRLTLQLVFSIVTGRLGRKACAPMCSWFRQPAAKRAT